MAKPTTKRWSKMTVAPGNEASPEVFTSKVCGFITKGFSITSDTSDSNVPDCDNPDLPSWVERITRSTSAQISGAGVMAEETFAFWRDWKLDGSAKKTRVVFELSTLPGYFEGDFLLTSFEISANESDGKIQVSVTLVSDGQVVWTNS